MLDVTNKDKSYQGF